jgi:hypothetical protein
MQRFYHTAKLVRCPAEVCSLDSFNCEKCIFFLQTCRPVPLSLKMMNGLVGQTYLTDIFQKLNELYQALQGFGDHIYIFSAG